MKKSKSYVLLGLAPFLWATDAILARKIHSYGFALDLVFLRWLIAFFVLLPFVFSSLKKQMPIIRQHLGKLFLLASLAIAISPISAYQALHYTTPLNTGIIEGTTPAFILLFTSLYYFKRPALLKILGALIAFIGVLFVILEGNFLRLSDIQWTLGDSWILLSVASWALYTLFLVAFSIPLTLPVFLCVIIFFGELLLTPLFLWSTCSNDFFIFNTLTVSIVLYIGIVPSLIAYIFWTSGVKNVGADKASSFMNLYPIFTTLLSVIFLSQQLFIYQLIGLILVCFGIYLLLRSRATCKTKS